MPENISTAAEKRQAAFIAFGKQYVPPERWTAAQILRDYGSPVRMVDAALYYARRGYHVFPVPPGTKKSYKSAKHSGGRNWGATTDAKEITRDFKRWPKAGIGIDLGKSGVFVIEGDTLEGGHAHDGIAALHDLQEHHGAFPKTRVAVSPTGSIHYYFKQPKGVEIRDHTGLVPGVDIKGAGGMVVAPPTFRPGKGWYRYLGGNAVAEAPQWLVDLYLEVKDDNGGERNAFTDVNVYPPADPKKVAAAAAAIENSDLGWKAWNTVGMAFWAAHQGSEEDFEHFDQFSKKSKKYDEDNTRARWLQYRKSPPNNLSAGKLYYLADRDSPGWWGGSAAKKLGFATNDKGVIGNSQGNIRHALELLGVRVRHDAFQDRSIIEGLEGFDLLDDRAMDRLWLLIDEKFKLRPSKEYFWTVVPDEARRNSFHPVREYLDGLKWDGKKRIDTWLTDYAQVEDTPYTRAVGGLMLIAAVRRIRKPGCKFDEMPVFISPQGLEKSSAFSILAVNPEWFSDDLPLQADSKTAIERMKGRWIIEAAELKGMRSSEVEHLKSFLSRNVDRARMSYDRTISELLRQCIIVGTTNDEQFLRDQTGNRRYWPIEVGAFDLAKLKADRDQLWAEACAREAQGVSIRLDRKLWAAAALEQEQRTVADPWVELIKDSLGDLEGKLPASEAWNIVDVDTAHRTQAHNERLGTAMKASGWKRLKARFGDHVRWAYIKGPQPHTELTISYGKAKMQPMQRLKTRKA